MLNEIRRCVICQGESFDTVFSKLFDDRYGYLSEVSLIKCLDCSHVSISPFLKAEEVATLYTTHYPRSKAQPQDFVVPKRLGPLQGWWEGARRAPFRWIGGAPVKCLDVGCGAGEAVAFLKSQGCDAYGVDADANVVKFAEALNLNIKAEVFEETTYPQSSFDFITMDQVIEHFSDPVKILKKAHVLLKPGGALVMSTPNWRSFNQILFKKKWLNWHVPYHQNFFSTKSFKLAAKKSGFQCSKVFNVTDSNWPYWQIFHALCFPRTMGDKNLFWSGLAPSVLRRRFIWPLEKLQRIGFFHLWARVIDWFGVGDNFVVIFTKPPTE